MPSQYIKSFKTHEEQLTLLKERGMIFNKEDEIKALHILEHNNYYRLSGYWLPFEEDHQTHKFKPNTKFESVLAFYNFDRKLRICSLSAIEKIEISIRSHFTYQLAKEYGSHPHLNSKNFKNFKYWEKDKEKLQQEITRSDEIFIKHYRKSYIEELPPIWSACEVMTIGLLSRFYSNLESVNVRKSIAKAYKIRPDILDFWLRNLRLIRNYSAHHCRLWDRLFKDKIQPCNTENLNKQLIPNSQQIYNSLVILLYLIDIISPNDSFRHELKDLLLKNKQNLLQMGFPDNWINQTIWQAT
jgi:abortive infection bacteriophage resistance protein